MLLSLAEDVSLIIHRRHIQEAIDVCTGELNGIMANSKKPGKSDLAEKMCVVVEVLIKAEGNQISRKELLRQKYLDLDVDDLGKVIDTLEAAGVLEVLKGLDGPVYKATDRQLQEINFLLKKKEEKD